MTTLNDLLEEYTSTRLTYDDAHAISAAADKEHKAAKAKLVDQMIADEQRGVKLDNGLAFNLRNQFSISCNKENEEDVKEWLHGHYGDVNEFTVEKVDKKTVEERLQADIEGEQLDEFDVPEFMKLKTRPDVSCTGWKQFSANERS
jgi:hypothetical protein